MAAWFLTIPAGKALSDPLEIPVNLRLARLGTPDAWDAAPITFLSSPDNTTYQDLYHVVQDPEGVWIPFEAAVKLVPVNGLLLMPPGSGATVGWLKIRSGTRSLPVAQTADRKFTLVFS
jgi:hypothetical protein